MAEEAKAKKEHQIIEEQGPEAFLLKYLGQNLHTFMFPGKEILGKFVDGGSYRFLPGINRVTREQWNLLKAHPWFKKWTFGSKATIIFIGGKKPDDAGAKGWDLNEYERDEAVSLVKATGDLNLLNDWLAEEKRGKVLQAIQNQIKAVGPFQKSDNDDDDDDDTDE